MFKKLFTERCLNCASEGVVLVELCTCVSASTGFYRYRAFVTKSIDWFNICCYQPLVVLFKPTYFIVSDGKFEHCSNQMFHLVNLCSGSLVRCFLLVKFECVTLNAIFETFVSSFCNLP